MGKKRKKAKKTWKDKLIMTGIALGILASFAVMYYVLYFSEVNL